jgi:hypothetical protein
MAFVAGEPAGCNLGALLHYGVGVLPRHRPSAAVAAVAALLAAALPAQLDRRDLEDRVQQTLAAARPALLAHLRAAASERATRPGELALVTLAAVHDGIDEAQLRDALKALAAATPDQTYDLALRLMVAEACPALPRREELAAQDARVLLLHRCPDGPFQYSVRPVAWDLSNTQYGILGLRAARALGINIEKRVWRQIVDEVGGQQDGFGGFGYTRFFGKGKNGNASMTAAGIAVLAICRQELGADSDVGRRCSQRIAAAWRWFAAHGAEIGSLKTEWSYYFHYGLERAAILCDVATIEGGVDWYANGATMLCDAQLPGGGWRSLTDGFPGHHLDRGRGDAVPTSFAVLFLRRKFLRDVTPITPRVVTLANLGPHSRPAEVAACTEALVQRGKAAMSDLVKGLRSEVLGQRQAAATALRQIAGEGFGYDPALAPDSDSNRIALRRAELWYLKNR